MNQELTVPPSKPLLDERGFQQLLSAAYTLQQRHWHVRDAAKLTGVEPAIASIRLGQLSRTDAEPLPLAIAQHAKLKGLTKPSADQITPCRGFLVVKKINLPIAGRTPKIWRTVEALAIGTVFGCFMVTASIPWFSSRARGASVSIPPAEQQIGLRKGKETATVANVSSKVIDGRLKLVLPNYQSSVIARDTVIRYINLPAGQHLRARTSGGGSQVSGAKHSGFAKDTDMIASDTVLRYDKELSPARKPVAGKALPTIPESLRSSAR